MSRRSQSRTLVASAVLLACLTLASRSYAQVGLGMPASASENVRGWSTLLARAQRILATDSTRIPRSLSKIHAALDQAARVSAVHYAALSSATGVPDRPDDGLGQNRTWMRTSRAWAS